MENKVKHSFLMWIQKTSLTISLKDALLWFFFFFKVKTTLAANSRKQVKHILSFQTFQFQLQFFFQFYYFIHSCRPPRMFFFLFTIVRVSQAMSEGLDDLHAQTCGQDVTRQWQWLKQWSRGVAGEEMARRKQKNDDLNKEQGSWQQLMEE